MRWLALRGRVFARFGDEGQRCILSGALDDSIRVVRFREPQKGTREEEVGVIVLGRRRLSGWQWRWRQWRPLWRLVWPLLLLLQLSWERLPLGHENLESKEEEIERAGVAGSKSRGGRKKENRRHNEKLEKKGDKVQLLQLSVWISVDCLSRWQNYNAEKWYSQLCLSFFLRNRKSINAITRGFVLGKFTKRHCRSVCKCKYFVCRFEKPHHHPYHTTGLCFTLIVSMVQAVLSKGRLVLTL